MRQFFPGSGEGRIATVGSSQCNIAERGTQRRYLTVKLTDAISMPPSVSWSRMSYEPG